MFRNVQFALCTAVVVSAALAGSPPARACDLCAIYSARPPGTSVAPGFYWGVAEQYTHFGTLQEDGHPVPNPAHQYLDSSISQLFVGYGLSSRVSLQFNLPLIYRSYRRPDGTGGIENGTVSGLGDVSLLGDVVLYQHEDEDLSLTWDLLGGIKFPTGNTERLREEFNEVEQPVGPPNAIHGHDLTLGSGSFDGIVGSSVFADWKRWFLSATVQYAIRSEGDFTYRFADDLTWSGGPGYYFIMNKRCALGLQAVVSGEYKELDQFQGAPSADTALTAVYLGPHLTFSWDNRLSLYVGGDLPVSLNNSALQIVPDYRTRGGLTWRF